MKKPKWVVEKEQAKRAAAAETVWLFGIHAVRDALENPAREKLRLIVTRNAAAKLDAAIAASGLPPEEADPRKFPAPIDPQSVHQGAALEVKPLAWGSLEDVALAVFAALGREPDIEFIPMPDAIREHYQYFTEADMGRLTGAGYARPFTSLEDGVGRYVSGYLNAPDPYV